jgi:thiol-disulfide isomerase/thioredoxin
MKISLTIFALFAMQITISCKDVSTNTNSNKKDTPESEATINQTKSENNFKVNVDGLQTDARKWYSYHYNNIHLAQDFIGLDNDSIEINKSEFLTRLTKGNFIPLKISIKDGVPVYRLYKFNGDNADIKTTITQAAFHELDNYNREGKKFPPFNFTDLNSNIYSNSNTHNKIVVLKCWFIQCVACVEEFPELNKLVEDYKDKNEVLFISLAMDSKEELTSFLQTKRFKYAVIPRQKKYMIDDMGISMFPTHILIDPNGKVVKVVNSVNDLIPFLRKETGKIAL